MLKLEISKTDLEKQLWPISFQDTLVFGNELLETEGLFGIKNNKLNFIPYEDIPDQFEIFLPENVEETMGFIGTAEYVMHRIMMTPKLTVSGFLDFEELEEEGREEVMSIFSKFIKNYARNKNALERIENKW